MTQWPVEVPDILTYNIISKIFHEYSQKAFIQAYSDVNGEYKRLRTVAEKEGGKTWDIVRNTALKDLKEKVRNI